MTEFSTIGELLELAERRMPRPLIDYILGGAGSEGTLRRNRCAMDCWAIEQRIQSEIAKVDISVEFLGSTLPSPMITAPMGRVRDIMPNADIEMLRGAGQEGSLATISNGADCSLQEAAEQAVGPLLAQILCSNGPAMQEKKLAQLHACPQFKGACVTIDGAGEPVLDRYVETHPLGHTGEFPNLVGRANPVAWPEIANLRKELSVPMGLKGIMSAEDARKGVDHGADFIWVSNHGARKFDSVRATIDVLDEVVAAVDGTVPIIVDSGFRRGSDVLKGLAKGATLVALGRLSICALGLGGAEGVAHLFQIMKMELKNALACTGRVSLAELTPDVLTKIDY